MSRINNITFLKEMFQKMVVEKNASLASFYYHPDFILYSNGKTMTFDEMDIFHQRVYQTPISYAIAYNENSLLEQGNKVAGQIFITTCMPNEKPTEIEVILIIEYKENKIFRAWELTYPNWTQMTEFEKAV